MDGQVLHIFFISVYARWKKGAFTIVTLFFFSLGYSRFVYKQCLNNEFAYPGLSFFTLLFLYLVVLVVLVSLDCIALIKTRS
jgi:hypothetical protein